MRIITSLRVPSLVLFWNTLLLLTICGSKRAHAFSNHLQYPHPPRSATTMMTTTTTRIGRPAMTTTECRALSTMLVESMSSTYNDCLQHHYWTTQSCTGAVFAGLGDVLAQRLASTTSTIGLDQAYSSARTRNYMIKGLLGGIMWSAWYSVADDVSLEFLRALLGSPMDVPLWQRVLACIVVEQVAVAPTFYALWDIPLPALLSGTPWKQIPNQIQTQLGPLLIANAQVWTPVNVITYSLPAEYRLVFSSAADLVWQTILSKITSQNVVAVNGNPSNSGQQKALSPKPSSQQRRTSEKGMANPFLRERPIV